ncbi:MAG: CpsB/CapC family capsule biosynthesis tyrosine phosphatase, partial [Sphingomonadales bacterium]
MHSHLIPGIDDGAPTLDHSIAMLNKFAQLGYR